MSSTRHHDVGHLLCIANDIAVATASYATAPALGTIHQFLHDIRQALGMDVAFISQIVAGRRRFEVVSAATSGPEPIAAGQSDALVDTYCKLVVDGELPPVIRDVADFPRAAALPITRALDIRSYLSARVLLSSGEVFGTLCCFSHQTRPDLVEADGEALQSIADAIAAGVERGEAAPGEPAWR
ncbi:MULTISPECIES: GAF domain-containing protein [Ramlibacter]|uniref:GAF domain-containing protein n=1 Tax=Ramlibacter pinisoli TaxID=2682844 RepID=A0A6N8IVT1_9BURK|nr:MULTISPECIES: GAF domain-containing protein [Ramlibacter]MBA2961120.1 GAF domain-containing protein [Ramlibacter sp. CGMCC 1.13660]MVQ31064.1 GAF domain-containing protein [Ramlibacter pinisoli]